MAKLSRQNLDFYVDRAREELVRVAKKRGMVSYSELMALMDGPGRGYIGQVLDELNKRESTIARPPLSALVLVNGTTRPGEGFFLLMRSLGRTELDDQKLWEIERDAVWAFDWTDFRKTR